MSEEEIQTVELWTTETGENTTITNNVDVESDNLVVHIEEPITQEQIEATMWDVSEAPIE